MALRPRLASLAAGSVLLASLGLSGASPARAAGDAICDTKPDTCGNLTIRISGYVAGNGYADNLAASPVLSCHHDPSATANSCTASFSVPGTSRTVQVRAVPANPTGITTCIANVCGLANASEVVLNFSVTRGGRTTANVSFTITDGHSITVTKGGTGSGTITSNKGGISCGSICTWGYFDSELVTLTATPVGESTFEGWTDTGTCQGQDATCHLVTGRDVTTKAVFNAPTAPPPTDFVTPAPPPSKAPPSTPTPGPTKTAGPSAGHSSGPTGPTIKPPSFPPGASPAPGTSQAPGSTQDDIASFDPSTVDPNAGPTPTPFKFATDDPNRTDSPLNELPSIAEQPAGNTGPPGTGPPSLVIGLIAVLGVLVGGGVFWWARRRNAAL